jgi:ParB family chromosome partitioning protein
MQLKKISVKEARPSKTNVAGRTEGKEFKDLVASIKEKGVLVPVLAREIHKGVQDYYEIVAGNRRLAAAKEAGLETIPAYVVEMTDAEAMEAQIIENLQRQDVHPLDEGEQYRKLIEEARYDTASLAAKVGKSESYVRQRLFLTNLTAKPAAAYRSGKLIDGQAVLIAKLSSADQEIALKATTNTWAGNSVADLKLWISEHIYSNLDNQPWLKSAEAAKAVGPCVECEPEKASLFGPVKEGACTSLKCWERKMKNFIAWKIAESKKDGSPGLAMVSTEYGSAPKGVYPRSEYVIVGKKSTDRCESVHGAIVANGADIGLEFDICTNPKCHVHRGMQSQYGLTPEEQERRREERKKEREASKRKDAKMEKQMAEALGKITWPLKEKHLETLLSLALKNCGFNTTRSIIKRHSIEVEKKKNSWGDGFSYDYNGSLKKASESMTKNEKIRLAFEILIDDGYKGWEKTLEKIK